ncbi:uncharacterized protein LOC120519052 isoform X1 [Polypterus senegalus]|uniref:uncharacterized protein LOC120519052 isoform X1 n=1 Tax=Polypterus senegalus TaxID=55291 RepID=UPI0019662D8B|nr:uncharacterized protein LOC120519052 isoform X1 [Polypterus senegalus]
MPGKKRKYNARFPPYLFILGPHQENNAERQRSWKGCICSSCSNIKSLGAVLKISLNKELSNRPIKAHKNNDAGTYQCIETEKHFHFLKDMVNRFSSLRPSQEQACSKSGGRKSWQDVGAKHKEHGKIQRTGGQMKGSTGFPDSDDSEPELVICIENKISQRTFKKRSGQSEMTRSNYFSGSHLVGISPVLTAPQ